MKCGGMSINGQTLAVVVVVVVMVSCFNLAFVLSDIIRATCL